MIAFLIATLAIHRAVFTILSEKLSLEHLTVAGEAFQSWWQFLSTYAFDISVAISVSAFSVILFSMVVQRTLPKFGWKASVIPLAGVLLVTSVIWRTRDGLSGFHSPYRIPSLAALWAQTPQLYAGGRLSVPAEWVPREIAKAQVLILVVDESVGSAYLGINGFNWPTTPHLASTTSQFVNLGEASSGGNHSASSNVILRSGLRMDQLPDGAQLSLRSPNIFQYARKAGYWTAYLDGQSDPQKFINYMRKSDVTTMDLLYRITDNVENVPSYQYDRVLLAQIRQILDAHESVFLYVQKQGTHFPYEGTYPPQERIFSPTMSVGSLGASTLAEVKGSYANAVRWGVDGFLTELLSQVDLQRTTIIYTSDHGQSIENKGAGVGTHGKVVAPPRSQVSVPMLVFGAAGESRLRPALLEVQNSTSHFQIFPSLLIMMGYPEEEVIKKYGRPLWKNGPGPRLFLSGDLFERGRAFVNKFD